MIFPLSRPIFINIVYGGRKSWFLFPLTGPLSIHLAHPSLEVITICMRGEKTEIRRDASEPRLALSFLIGIASSSALRRELRTLFRYHGVIILHDSTQKLEEG